MKPSTTVGTVGEAMAGLGGLLGDWAESATVATVGLSETVKETMGASIGRQVSVSPKSRSERKQTWCKARLGTQ